LMEARYGPSGDAAPRWWKPGWSCGAINGRQPNREFLARVAGREPWMAIMYDDAYGSRRGHVGRSGVTEVRGGSGVA
jgi:hypothetical protein